MAAAVGLVCGLNPRFKFSQLQQKCFEPIQYHHHHHHPHAFTYNNNNKKKMTPQDFKISANLGGGGGGGGGEVEGEGELKQKKKNKFITKEQEPQQYWQTAGEREGENPMKTPLPYIIIFGMSTPFVILAIAFANGWIKAPIR